MTELEEYLDSLTDKTLNRNIFNEYEKFNYDTKEIFEIVLNNLLENVYQDIKIKENKSIRLDQKEFSQKIKELYETCVITGANADECEAAHIIPVSDNGSYSIDNGILLSANIHKTFDKYLWSINIETKQIEVNPSHNGTIKKYEYMKVNLNWNKKLEKNLSNHYLIFNKKN
jgi:predicted restriction endonuclease